MCWPIAIPIAMAGMQMLQGQQAGAASASAQVDQSRRQSRQMIKEMNWKNADLDMKAKDQLDTASQELTTANMAKVQNMGMVRAAIGESGMEGNSMNRLNRVTEGDMIREMNSVTDNYKRDYAAIFAQQIGARETTISQIEAMQANEPKRKGKLEAIADPLGLGLGKVANMATGWNPLFKSSNKKIVGKIEARDKKSLG